VKMADQRTIRVFPRRTNATPTDALAVSRLPELFDEADKVHVSVAFEWDLPLADRLAKEWEAVGPVEVGGPATGGVPGEFEPGKYLRMGYTITSRGCPNTCWFCQAWRKEGEIRLLAIREGYNVLDNNLLACPAHHIVRVFEMLERQAERPRFTGGLEAKRLLPWHVEWLARLRPEVAWFAYDTPDDWGPLCDGASMLEDAGLITGKHRIGCYVLIGWPGDTIDKAEKRLRKVVSIGLFPQAMLLDAGKYVGDVREWKRFAREWSSKVIVGAKMRKYRESPSPLSEIREIRG
jgi:hypothetical protein